LEEYVGEKLKLLAARSNGFDKDDDIIRKAEDYRNQLLVERLTEVEVDEKIAYSEKELVEYYEENKTEYIEEETVRATCVSLTDEKKAEKAYAMYQEGIDLAEIAETFKNDLQGPGDSQNDPGNTGEFRRDASENWMPFVEAMFGMEVGEESTEQMELDVGDNVFYLLFRKESQTPARQQTFEEVRDSIVTIIEQQKKRERILAWVEDVTAKGKLKFYPDKVPVPEVPSDDEESSEESSEESNAEEEK
jgi:parvulin-like peptidyl-prolyl isomerase